MLKVTTLAFGAMIICSSLALAFTPSGPPVCMACGRDFVASSTRIVASGPTACGTGSVEFCSAHCLYIVRAQQSRSERAASFEVLDYSTYDTDSPVMINGISAWYLFGTDEFDGSAWPYAAAFASKEAAREAGEELGGKLVQGWGGLLHEFESAEKTAFDEAAAGSNAHTGSASVDSGGTART